jgi:hypothetical protein
MKKALLAALVLLAAAIGDVSLAQAPEGAVGSHRLTRMDTAKFDDWRSRWERSIVRNAQTRYCDTESGEEIGWLISPFLKGFYYGYLATRDLQWVDRFVDWADALVSRAVKEPDGYFGWPKTGAAGTRVDGLNDFKADSLVGEAMALSPMVLMAGEILRTPALREKYGPAAERYLRLSETIFEKWDVRGAWRATEGGGIISVVLPFGIDERSGQWTDGYATRQAPTVGFSHPNNKANLVALWLLAMSDVTQKQVYKERAEKWFRVMKSRMTPIQQGTFQIWNYWQPAGPWDYRFFGLPKQWIAVHTNAAYYEIDVEALVAAYEHGLVFTNDDIRMLIATAAATKRNWNALVPYDVNIQKAFEDTNNPDRWYGLVATPWYLALQARTFGLGR